MPSVALLFLNFLPWTAALEKEPLFFSRGVFFFKKLNWHFLTQISIKVRAYGIVEKYSHFALSLSLSLSLFPSLVFRLLLVCLLLLLTRATTNNFIGLKILNLNSFSRKEREF